MKQYVYYIVFESDRGKHFCKEIKLDKKITDLKDIVSLGIKFSGYVIDWKLLRVEGKEEEKKSKYEIADEVLNEYMNTENAPSSFGDFLYKKINRR